MVDFILILPIMISFLVSYFIIPSWIRKAKTVGLMWQDMNKISGEKIAGSGGIISVMGFVIGVLIFVSYRVFAVHSSAYLIEILAILTSITFLAGVGLVDDLLGWQRGGLRRRHRIILVAVAAIPLMAINAGKSEIFVPFIGSTDIGILYSLIIVPIGLVGATTTFNFLAGFNGLEAGQGIILLGGISIVAFLLGSPWISVIALCMIASLLGFLIYNFYPAKVFPGDSLTYAVGGLFAMLSILGNFERIALFFFIPYIIEFCLKTRGKLGKYSFGDPKKDGTLDLRYNKIYSLNHLSIFLMKKMNIAATERRAVFLIWGFQALIILIGIIIFRNSIF